MPSSRIASTVGSTLSRISVWPTPGGGAVLDHVFTDAVAGQRREFGRLALESQLRPHKGPSETTDFNLIVESVDTSTPQGSI